MICSRLIDHGLCTGCTNCFRSRMCNSIVLMVVLSAFVARAWLEIRCVALALGVWL